MMRKQAQERVFGRFISVRLPLLLVIRNSFLAPLIAYVLYTLLRRISSTNFTMAVSEIFSGR